jgi:dipeptidyl aminopeptidase/acylaminoacyl peptidase
VGDFVTGSAAAWDQRKDAIKRDILWALGEEPAGLPFVPVQRPPGQSNVFWVHPPADNPMTYLFGTPFRRPTMGSVTMPFGDGLRADLYYPPDGDGQAKAGKWPVIVWLHPYSYATGYSRYVIPTFESLIKRGFAVLAFDQLGFGTRVLDARYFYHQYPQWSLMGRMVADTRGAIDAVAGLDVIDASRIYLVGYSLGGKVGLLTAALDTRVKAVASACGYDPLRLESPTSGTEGVRQYSHLHGLMPRLGFFVGQETRLPFDYDQALALIAPRPVLLIAPTLDRYARAEDVRREVEEAKKIYRQLGREDALQLETPLNINRFTRPTQEHIFDWIAGLR